MSEPDGAHWSSGVGACRRPQVDEMQRTGRRHARCVVSQQVNCALFLNQSEVSRVLGINVCRDSNERPLFHPVSPMWVATEGEPVEARGNPLVIEDQDLRMSVLESRERELVGESSLQVS